MLRNSHLIPADSVIRPSHFMRRVHVTQFQISPRFRFDGFI